MFTGIIETLGTVQEIQSEKTNLIFTVSSAIAPELKIDQSLAHNGVCLTVTETSAKSHKVTAIEETLQKTNLQQLKVGDLVNLERCLPANGRFDGHFVQGHIDQTGICTQVKDEDGSWRFWFEYVSGEAEQPNFTIPKGSITINGVSLTVVDSDEHQFSVAIIPYTYENTNFQQIKVGDTVNLEFDVLGKYMIEILKRRKVLGI